MSQVSDHTKGQGASLRLQVYRRLRLALRHGLIEPDQVETERGLAEQLGMSRTPVREALALLVHDGLIASTSRGFALPDISSTRLEEISQIRLLIEPAAIAQAVDHLSPHDLRKIGDLLEEQQAANNEGDAGRFSDANLEFKTTWVSAVPNQELRNLIERYNDHTHRIRELTLQEEEWREIVLTGLGKVVSALDRRCAASAQKAMTEHLEAGRKALSKATNAPRALQRNL